MQGFLRTASHLAFQIKRKICVVDMDYSSGLLPHVDLDELLNLSTIDPSSLESAWLPFDATATALSTPSMPAPDLYPASEPTDIRKDAESTPRRRKQNRSCDQCRVSKKACDLPPPTSSSAVKNEVATRCGMCAARGIECTSVWLDRQKGKERSAVAKRVAHMTEQRAAREAASALPTALSLSADAALSRPSLAQSIIARNLALYVEAFEIPMAECLMPGSLPPTYAYGLHALKPLREETNLVEASSESVEWSKEADESRKMTSGSQTIRKAALVFQAAGLLDAIFAPASVKSPKRAVSIAEGYKWVAVATAAQYNFAPMHVGGPRRRDVAHAAFQRAKEAVFNNISATQSFRHALSMLLLGVVSPLDFEESKDTFEEDATYAFHGGARRLQRLCADARNKLERRESRIPSSSYSLIIETVFAVQWLVDLIYTSFRRSSDIGDVLEHTVVSQGLACADAEESVAARALETKVTFIEKWNKSELLTQTSGQIDDQFFSDARQLASMTVLLWKRVKRLQADSEALIIRDGSINHITALYEKAISAIRIWRRVFGGIDSATDLHFAKASSNVVWRAFALCSNDADFAILLFCDITQNLRHTLASVSQGSTKSFQVMLDADTQELAQQRLVSAIRVSMIAAASHAREAQTIGRSQADSIQNIVMHPVCQYCVLI